MNIHSEELKSKRKERNSQIVYLKQKGYTYNEIANKYNLCRETIKHVCHQHGVGGIIKKTPQLKLF